MTFKNFLKELNGEKAQGELIKSLFASLLTSFIVLGILYLFRFKNIENFIPKYGFFLFFAVLSYAIIIPSLRHIRVYRELPCMSGMMVGMTTGMIAGFLAGFYVASTNGMFVGSLFGMLIGISLGIWNGKCCGIMGVMEGMMAGFMGGLMGAMTAFMLLNDHLKTTSVVVFAVAGFIIFGLNYLIYKETREHKPSKESHFFDIFISFILTILTAWLIVFGPRTGALA